MIPFRVGDRDDTGDGIDCINSDEFSRYDRVFLHQIEERFGIFGETENGNG